MWVHTIEDTPEGEAYKQSVQSFNENFNGKYFANVEFIPRNDSGGGYSDKINASVMSGDLPDVITVDGPNVSAYAANGIIQPLFTTAFWNTVKFVLIIVPAQTLGALGLALLINKATVCKKYFKVAFFIPVVMSLAVVSNLWMQIYSPEGILNTMLAQIGIEAQPFIYSADQALPSIAIMSVWQGVGYQMIIFLSKYEISGIGDKMDFVFNSSRIHFFDKNTEVCYV